MSAGTDAAPSTREMATLASRIFRGSAEQVLPRGFGDQSSPFSTSRRMRWSRSRRRSATTIAPSRSLPPTTPRSNHRMRVMCSGRVSCALDRMAETSRQALSVAPADPVLNQYYLSTLGAREVTLRQLGSVLPPGTRLSRF